MAYNRLRGSREFDAGVLLLSLSLDDSPLQLTGLHVEEIHEDYGYVDDPMDIDITDDIINRNDIIQDISMDIDEVPPYDATEKYSEQKSDQESNNDDGLLSLLSPTMLGAKLAIKKPLLLMPPTNNRANGNNNDDFGANGGADLSEEARNYSSDIDYEFDTSSFQPIKSDGVLTRKSNTTSFQSTNIDSFLPGRSSALPLYESNSGDFHEHFVDRQHPVTIHNHHHHYYYYNSSNDNNESTSKMDELLEEKKQLQIER